MAARAFYASNSRTCWTSTAKAVCQTRICSSTPASGAMLASTT